MYVYQVIKCTYLKDRRTLIKNVVINKTWPEQVPYWQKYKNTQTKASFLAIIKQSLCKYFLHLGAWCWLSTQFGQNMDEYTLLEWTLHWLEWSGCTGIDQSHRYGRHQVACREPAGSYDKTTRTTISFEHKMQYLLIRAPYTRMVVFWHISNIPPMIPQSQISCNTPMFYITAIFVKYCYTTVSWLL